MKFLPELAENLLIFLAAFIVSTGTCTKKVVQCGAERTQISAPSSAGP